MKNLQQTHHKILIIANPVAGKKEVSEHFDDVYEQLKQAGHNAEIFYTKKEGDATLLTKRHHKNKDLIICAGGDGTLNEVISGLLKYDINIPLGYIPMGTTNDLASSLAIPTNALKATNFILENSPKYYDIASFNEDLYFDYIASFGAFSKTAYATPQWFKNRLGYHAYILSSLTMLDSLKPYELCANINGEKIEGKFIFGGVSNSNSVGGIIDLTEETKLDDGKFEVLLVKFPESITEVAALLDNMINKHIDNKSIFLYHSTDVNFEFTEKTAWTLDGEYGGEHKNVKIKVIHNKIKIIY